MVVTDEYDAGLLESMGLVVGQELNVWESLHLTAAQGELDLMRGKRPCQPDPSRVMARDGNVLSVDFDR